MFERRLIQTILLHMRIRDIALVCQALPSWRDLWTDELFWEQLFQRDYGIFRPVIEGGRNWMTVYKEFHSNPLCNSSDFRKIYTVMLKYTPSPQFYDEHLQVTTMPSISGCHSFTSFAPGNLIIESVLHDQYQKLETELNQLGFLASVVYAGATNKRYPSRFEGPFAGSVALFMRLWGRRDGFQVTFSGLRHVDFD